MLKAQSVAVAAAGQDVVGELLDTSHDGQVEVPVISTGTLPPPRVRGARIERKEYDADEHMLTVAQLAERFQTSINLEKPGQSKGLTQAEAARRLQLYGPNSLTPPKQKPEIVKFLLQFTNGLLMLLIVASGLAFLAYGIDKSDGRSTSLILALVLLGIILLTGTLNYMHEKQAGDVLASIKSMLPAQCAVIRDGKELKVPAEQLVIGDLVHLTIGNRIPADIRLVSSADFKVEMSSLTGEGDAIECVVQRKSDHPNEARNLVFNSSLTMNGDAVGVVYRVGDDTMIGSIAGLAGGTKSTKSSMEREIGVVIRYVIIFAIITAISLFVIGMARGRGWTYSIINGLLLTLVANVPEGLPTTVVTSLTLTAKQMAERHVFVKRTDIIETVGSATVICSDKTGTLTKNLMTVENVWCNKSFSSAGKVRKTAGKVRNTNQALAHMTVGRSMALHNGTMVIQSTRGRGAGTIGRNTLANAFNQPQPQAQATAAPAASAESQTESKGSEGSSFASPLNQALAASNKQLAAPMEKQNSFRSFNSFQGMGQTSWAESNPFTRLVTIAGVCNRAQFSVGDDETPVTAAGEVMQAVPRKVGYGIPMAALRAKQGTGSAAKSSSGGDGGNYRDDKRKILGDASESALLRYVDSLVPSFELKMNYPVVFELPFNSVNKYALAITRDPETHSRHILMMKGAPERILDRCTHYLHNGEEKPIDDDFKAEYQAAYERFGFMGERVLGFAYKAFHGRDPSIYKRDENSYPTQGLVFCGLISLVDPPKDGVDEAVDKCKEASVRVVMVTGDHPITAEAIARKTGIITLPTAREIAAEDGVAEEDIALSDPRVRAVVMAGFSLPALSQEQWDALLSKDEIVFARTSPQQKLQIVENFQRLGNVVAVTGDGTNDSPALKKADIGVSMGGAGASDVAKDAAGILLLDDNFASIVYAIEAGRLVFDNLRKTIAYTLTHAVPELVPLLLDLAFGIPLPLPGLLILSIDLITEQGPAISLAYEAPEADIMARPPRNMKKDRLIDGRLFRYAYLWAGCMETLVCLLSYFCSFVYNGVYGYCLWNTSGSDKNYWTEYATEDLICSGKRITPAMQLEYINQAHAAYYFALVACQVCNVFVCKTRFISLFEHGPLRNHITAYGIFVSIFISLFFIYVNGIQNLFQTANMPGYWFITPLAFAVIMVPATEWSKKKARQDPNGWWARNMAW